MCACCEGQVDSCDKRQQIKRGGEESYNKGREGGREGGREVMQHLSQFTSALLPADDTPQRPSPVQPLQMSLMSLSN